MSMFDGLISKLKEESRTIVFTEGTDRRILEALYYDLVSKDYIR